MIDVQDQDIRWRVGHIKNLAPVAAVQSTHHYETVFEYYADTFSALPKEIQLAVSVLKMHTDNEYVAGIGRRVSSKLFWLDDGVVVRGETK